MNNTNKIILSIAIGAITGVALGILFAPDKGSNTQKKMAESANDIFSDVKEKLACKKENIPA